MSNIYFASDFHLGLDAELTSKERELKVVAWLSSIEHKADAIYLLGDIFDFWFEYHSVVPKGYLHLLGKLADLKSKGIEIFIFTGNHDMWMFSYLEKELDIPIIREHITKEIDGKKFYLGHGDGIGPGDHGYKFIKRVFRNRLAQFLFARLHPNLAFAIAQFWSKQSRVANREAGEFLGEDREWQVLHAKQILQQQHVDYFIFGHRHIPKEIRLTGTDAKFINLGDWVYTFTYAHFDGNDCTLVHFKDKE